MLTQRKKSEVLTNKVLTHWSWKHIWKNGSFSKEKCDRLCKKNGWFYLIF
jgi:hypothetical protein